MARGGSDPCSVPVDSETQGLPQATQAGAQRAQHAPLSWQVWMDSGTSARHPGELFHALTQDSFAGASA